jgi:mannose-6-phosphate isomerase-like protein (cupin superfamily)
MIIKHWKDCPLVVTHGRLREWQIFTKRVGDTPNAETGAVCFDYTCYGRAALLPGVTTEPTTHADDVESFFVSSGQGTVEAGGERKDLREGSMVFIPAGAEHRITNTGTAELELIFSRRPPAKREHGAAFGVRHWSEDRDREAWGTPFQGHWYHIWRGPTCGDVHLGDIPARKFAHPHNHTDVLDEIWYVRSGNGWHWMGKEYHEHTAGYALWLDPSAIHSLMSPGDENVEYIYSASWMLVQDREAEAAGRGAEPETNDPVEVLNRLQAQFDALVAGYRKTEISIFGVDRNIGGIQAKIEALRKMLPAR